MLDERGIEYVSIGGITNWEHAEFDELADGSDTRLIVYGATPEQAVTATVGAGTLTAEQVRECLKGVYFEGYSDGATHRVNGIEETDWQAIADELMALLGQRTCKNIGDGRFVCSECGAYVQIIDVGRSFLDESGKRWYWTSNKRKFRHCPNCGKRIEEEAE
jgi:predicted RNA-binding Zn-ribbon protein involved in translation (DUF1610 family)